MRGKVYFCHHVYNLAGITPAYAGKSLLTGRLMRITRDHPRLCGEKIFPFLYIIGISGSPPPMRGKVESGYLNDDETGITPAYAGKRYSKFKTLGAKRDHPRLCGEKFRHVASKGYTLGSPPPMRGKVVPVGVVTVLSRITPAYAGKSLRISNGKWHW